MGCGGSRLAGVSMRGEEAGVVPLSSGIRRRLEEIKKRSHASVLRGSQTQSKKELLPHGSSEDGEDMEENEGSLKSSAKVAPAPDHHVEEKKEVIYEKVSTKDDVKEVKKEEEEVVKKPEEENNHLDQGTVNNFDERMLGPGSPSFRVYCVDIASSDDEEEKEGEDTRKSMETESVIMEPKEEESVVPKTEKRERRGKKFGITLPRRYLTNVTGGGCMGNTHSRLVPAEKPSQ